MTEAGFDPVDEALDAHGHVMLTPERMLRWHLDRARHWSAVLGMSRGQLRHVLDQLLADEPRTTRPRRARPGRLTAEERAVILAPRRDALPLLRLEARAADRPCPSGRPWGRQPPGQPAGALPPV